MITLSPKDPSEVLYYGIDFGATGALGPTETISSATSSIRVTRGTDPNASSMLDGAPIISGRIVRQRIAGGVAGVVYQFGITITTSAGQVLVEAAPLQVLEKD